MSELEEKGIFTSNTTVNRGTSPSTAEDIAMRVLTVVVSEEQSNEIFEFLYDTFNMYEAHNGMIHQQKLLNMTEYRMPTQEEIDTKYQD